MDYTTAVLLSGCMWKRTATFESTALWGGSRCHGVENYPVCICLKDNCTGLLTAVECF